MSSSDYREMREATQAKNAAACKDAKEFLEVWIGTNECDLEALQSHQLRVFDENTTVDIYPVHKKFHFIRPHATAITYAQFSLKNRGKYTDLEKLLNHIFLK